MLYASVCCIQQFQFMYRMGIFGLGAEPLPSQLHVLCASRMETAKFCSLKPLLASQFPQIFGALNLVAQFANVDPWQPGFGRPIWTCRGCSPLKNGNQPIAASSRSAAVTWVLPLRKHEKTRWDYSSLISTFYWKKHVNKNLSAWDTSLTSLAWHLVSLWHFILRDWTDFTVPNGKKDLYLNHHHPCTKK